MLIKKINDVPAQDVNMEGAKDVKVRVLLGPKDNAPTFAMRLFELAPGGHTPFHTHPYEHEVIVLEGDVVAVTETGENPVSQGNVLLVVPDEKHQFQNRSDTKIAKMICLIPVEYQK